MNLSSKFPLFAVLILLISTGCTDNPYRDEDAENQIASYGVLVHPMTNNHSAAPGFDTDFILTVWNIGSETATYKMEVTHKDEGIETVSFEQNMNNITILADGVLPLIVNVNLSSSATGILRTDIEFSSESNEANVTTSQKVTLEVNSDVTFDRRSQIGDLVKVHYAGILAKNSKLFDSSMEYVWNTYPYYNDGVSDANVHTDTLPANNIGCFEQSTKDGVILSYIDTRFSAYEGGLRVGMEIEEFEGQIINTYEEFYDAINATSANQTVAISVVNETAGVDNYTVEMTDLGDFYVEFYPGYYQSWMDGKGFMGINAEEKTALNSDLCAGSRQMIVGFDNKMVGMYEGQTLAVRIPAKDAYGEVGYSPLAGEDLLFLIEMVETIHKVVVQEPDEVTGDTWGQLTTNIPDIYKTSDVPQSQIDTLMSAYNTSSGVWGNYGPLEFWVVGNDWDAAYELDKQYCSVRMDKDPSITSEEEQYCLERSHNMTSYVEDGGAGLNTRRNNYDDYSVFVVTFASKYPYPDETDYTVVAYHEYFHVYQHAHIFTKDDDDREELMGGNPYWAEGGAEYMAQLLYSRQDGVESNYLKERMTWKMEAKNDLQNNESIVDIPYGPRGNIAYDLGSWYVAYIINQTSEDAYLNGFYDDLNDLGWEGSFVENFGVSSEQMLSDFYNFLDLTIEEQLEIIP